MGNGGEWEVPREVLAVLPSDPYEQLDVARRITAMAIDSKVSRLELDVGRLSQKLSEKEHMIRVLQERIADADATIEETSARLSQALDDQARLAGENGALQATVKRLNRDVAKLETFKRTLMQSLQEEPESESPARSELVEKLTNSRPSSSNSSLPVNNSNANSNASKAPSNDDSPPRTAPQTPQQHTPQQTPTGSPRWQSMSGSPRRSVAMDSRVPLPLSLPTSKSTTAPNSPPNVNSLAGRTPRVDGKEFFRQARNRLSYEQFSSFLANIKELNAHRQTREETLRKADETFGPENKDLYVAFDALLSRHIPS